MSCKSIICEINELISRFQIYQDDTYKTIVCYSGDRAVYYQYSKLGLDFVINDVAENLIGKNFKDSPTLIESKLKSLKNWELLYDSRNK